MAESSESPTAWLFLSIDGRRQYGGNTGYDDVPGEIYRFDSLVANARHVSARDVVVFRDRSGGTGFAKIETVSERNGSKEILRCPECNAAQIKERTTIRPRFRCKNKHEFETPQRETRSCIEYEARFGNTYVPANPPIPSGVLRGACERFNGQLSIQRISVGLLAPVIGRVAANAISMLGLDGWELRPLDALDASQSEGSFVPTGEDARESVLRQIRARRGQTQFRDSLLQRYGPQCLISGCELVDVVEAAHIHPYRSESDNNPENGLLLRCDLHTLFDVDMLGIEPTWEQRAECHQFQRGGDPQWDRCMRWAHELRPSARAFSAE